MRRELIEGIGSLLEWRKGVRWKKTETHRKIVRGSRKACRELGRGGSSISHIRLRVSSKSEDKAKTFVESSIPYSHGRRALVIKGAEEVENAKTNSKYQDMTEGQKPKNFIRLVSMGFSSR
ncbi:hypothetical protein B296_00029535 [Ensete ventricosum]|uniref:Uncharacterized protein n=1 Tax=Ensete ventricosum TaxID=4639 RepID=A0A426XZE6_ENSVE|nr:hypothetical protein B296_00029535 [Ensete ventricosum]